MRLFYLVDIFEKLNSLNLHLQGNRTNRFVLSNRVNGFCKKIQLWNTQLKANFFEMFHIMCEFIQSYSPEENYKKAVLKTVEGYFENLSTTFSNDFCAENYIKLGDRNWEINSFESTPTGIYVCKTKWCDKSCFKYRSKIKFCYYVTKKFLE